ncbi:hypothetical protein GCM10010430_52990 [Kitasatospora cystarginea]|uniref:Uncharacterized protein n=1 Tax=Kitasatospora cystarginea TaxID=58350 RepID=A0ABN3EL77_9ACTN
MDKKWALTWGNVVIHGIHKPYYYHYTYRPLASINSGVGQNLWTVRTRHLFGLASARLPSLSVEYVRLFLGNWKPEGSGSAARCR